MSVASRRERERAERRANILRAAEKLFFSKGFAETTMGEIAAEAELSKGTLYLYFKNKDELFLALSEGVIATVIRRFEAIVASGDTGIEQLRQMLHAYAESVTANRQHFRAAGVWLASGYQVDTDAQCFVAHRGRVARMVACLVRGFAAGQKDGTVSVELNPMQTASQLWGGLFGILILHINATEMDRRFPQPIDHDTFVAGYIDILCKGLAPRGSKEASP